MTCTFRSSSRLAGLDYSSERQIIDGEGWAGRTAFVDRTEDRSEKYTAAPPAPAAPSRVGNTFARRAADRESDHPRDHKIRLCQPTGGHPAPDQKIR